MLSSSGFEESERTRNEIKFGYANGAECAREVSCLSLLIAQNPLPRRRLACHGYFAELFTHRFAPLIRPRHRIGPGLMKWNLSIEIIVRLIPERSASLPQHAARENHDKRLPLLSTKHAKALHRVKHIANNSSGR
jgi:hypothetical protein